MTPDYSPLAPLKEILTVRRKQAAIHQENIRLILDALRMVLVLVLALVLFSQYFSFRVVSGNSMYPAISDGDLVLTYRNRDLVKNDVVFYEYQNRLYLGRVVAKGGDTIKIDESGTFYVNGTPQTTEVAFPTYASEEWHGLTRIPEGTVFLLGDFRTSTLDSRDFGPIPVTDVHYKVFALIRHRGV